MRFSEFNITEDNKYKDIVFLKPGQLKGSYSDRQLTDLGFKKSSTGTWYISRKKYNELVSQNKLNEFYSDDLDEGWRDQLFGLGLAGAVALGSTGVMTAKQALTSPKQNQPAATTTAPNTAPNTAPVTQQQAKPAATKQPTVNYITSSPREKFLMGYAKKAGLSGYELAQFMAQCAHETRDFSRLAEQGGKNYFKRYDPKYSPDRAKRLGNTKIGDGIRFKGRGFIQLTGRYNYRIAGQAIGKDLINNPRLAEDPDIAAQIALWYWGARVKPKVSDFKNTTEVTKTINSGLKGLEDRHENFIEYIAGDEDTPSNMMEKMVASDESDKLDELKCWPGYTRVRGVPAGKPGSCKKKVSEQADKQNYLWHGSKRRLNVLVPKQAHDTGGEEGSNRFAIYATADKNTAIKMGMATDGSDTGMFDQKDQLILFKGKLRHGENVYLHKLPRYDKNGKDMWKPGGNNNEFSSLPHIKSIHVPDENIIEEPVDRHLDLVRTPTKKDLELRKYYLDKAKKSKQKGLTEGSYKEGGSITHDGVEYDFDKVLAIAETKPIKQCPVNKLKWVLSYDKPDINRLKNADISFPIVITKSNNGKLTVIDGLHRLAKAVDSNIKSLPVKYITSGELQSARLKQGVAEGKIKLYTDPEYYGADVDDTGFDKLPTINIPIDKLTTFEPSKKMHQTESKTKIKRMVTKLKKGDKLPAILVRKYKKGYQVLDGHHRFWAHKIADIKSIPAKIVPDSDIDDKSKKKTSESFTENTGDPKKDPEAYKQYLITTLPSIMRFLKNAVSGWTPSNEQMLDVIDVAYNVMKDTGNIKLAGKAFTDELDKLHKMNQNVSEGQ